MAEQPTSFNLPLPVLHFKDTAYQIADLQLFRGIADEHFVVVQQILNSCPVVIARAGQVVLDASTAGACLYIVLRGALGITPPGSGHTKEAKRDTDKTPLANVAIQYLAGESVGEIGVLDEEIHPATITALEDSELLEIEAAVLWRLIDESNCVAKNLLQLLSFRVRAANAQIRKRQKVGEFYRQLSMVDGLTGLHNRSWLNTQLPAMVEHAHATGRALAVIMVDLDHFKLFNDEYGHVLGDDALQTAAKVLNAGLRPSDFAARYGGEEMLVILPNTHQKAALGVAERLCIRLRNTRVFGDITKPLPHVTGSFGLATLHPDQDAGNLIASADAALYRAKQAGRDQVSN